MKVSFSTLGCPGWSWEDMLATAKDLGFDGIEIRGIGNELHVPGIKLFLRENMDKTRAKISKLGLSVPCLTSSSFLFDKSDKDKHIDEAKQYIDTASRLGCPYVRVLGDSNPEPGEKIDDGFVAENLLLLGKYAEGKDVKVLIETNGVYADSEKLAKLLGEVSNANTGVLWDVHHPFRFMNEPVKKTYDNLKEYIEHVHVKDSIAADGNIKYKMMGYGDVSVKDALLILKDSGYTGYVSLEWVKRWCLELEEPGIVFSHFINYVKDIIA